MESIPPEVLRIMFNHFDDIHKISVSRVCRLWRYLILSFKLFMFPIEEFDNIIKRVSTSIG